MKTNDEYFLNALSKVGEERHGNKTGPIVLTIYSTGHAQAVCNAALTAQAEDFETRLKFHKWILDQIEEGNLIYEGGNFFCVLRDEDDHPLMHPPKISEEELYENFTLWPFEIAPPGFSEPDEEEDTFTCCCDCDLPDACSDFGCAIEQGIKRKPEY